MELIKTTQKSLKFLLTMCPDKKMQSIYLNYTKGGNSCVSRKAVSILSINRHAYGGANLVPILVPDICSLICPLNSKQLFFRTKSAILISLLVGILCCSLLSSTSLRAFNPVSCGMLGYKPTTSVLTKIAFWGIEPNFRVFFIKSPESLIYDHPLCIKSFK